MWIHLVLFLIYYLMLKAQFGMEDRVLLEVKVERTIYCSYPLWALKRTDTSAFHGKAIWRLKTPSNITFMVEWYCTCKHSGDTVDHLLIHYSSAMDYWAFVFLLLGVKWVVSNSVQELLQCWRRRPKSFRFRGGRAFQLRKLS